MAKRQIRLNNAADIRKKLPELSGKKVNIVRTSGAIFFVRIEQVSGDILTISDMRRTKSQWEVSDISEIIIDFEA
ncbi:hypothetical protein FNH22_22880 [Fulvivirga sp. M361]|uniref:hypothetical protein n=1 Tax=Fulvivirga sp. M361 TaxID=2594266 RepID=UPI00117B3D86|nr:hypothetical protein [Fulvivirga sp. M361]TRX52020.1 hypothetical protein FNH22_22880 [Fulvivirga sp. M361]